MKTFFIASCMLFSLVSNGQKHRISINYKPSLTYFGKQNQNFDHNLFKSRDGNKTFNNSFNLLYSYKLAPKFILATGVEFSQQGQDINFNTNGLLPKNGRIFWTELNYFRIPLTIGYSIFSKNNSELNFHTGVSLGIVSKRNDNFQHINIFPQDILVPFVPAEKRYKDQDWAIPFGINYQRALTKNTFAIFGVEYLIGLTNSLTEDGGPKFGVLSEFDNSKQNRLSINIGIGFNLSK